MGSWRRRLGSRIWRGLGCRRSRVQDVKLLDLATALLAVASEDDYTVMVLLKLDDLALESVCLRLDLHPDADLVTVRVPAVRTFGVDHAVEVLRVRSWLVRVGVRCWVRLCILWHFAIVGDVSQNFCCF